MTARFATFVSAIAPFHSPGADFASGFSGFASDLGGFGQLDAARAFTFVTYGSWFDSSCAYLAAAATLLAAGVFDVGAFAFKDGAFASEDGTFAFFHDAVAQWSGRAAVDVSPFFISPKTFRR